MKCWSSNILREGRERNSVVSIPAYLLLIAFLGAVVLLFLVAATGDALRSHAVDLHAVSDHKSLWNSL